MLVPLFALAALAWTAGWAYWALDRHRAQRERSKYKTRGEGVADVGRLPWELVDQHGHAVTQERFRGQWQLVYFGYTSCPVCSADGRTA